MVERLTLAAKIGRRTVDSKVEEIPVFHLLNLPWLGWDVKVIGLVVYTLMLPGMA
jgi:hypothetical protein